MKRPDVRAFVHDAEIAGQRIGRFLGGMPAEEYRSNELVRAAVERQFEIIGEALANAVKAKPDLKERITALPRVIAFRNQLAHGYFGIDPDVVWAVAHDHLPELIGELREILGSLDAEESEA